MHYGGIILDYLKNCVKKLFYIFHMYKGNDTDDTSILAEFLCLSFRKVCIGIHENITPEKLIRMSYAVYISNL